MLIKWRFANMRKMSLEYSVQPTPYWTYNGKNLQEIYDETYEVRE